MAADPLTPTFVLVTDNVEIGRIEDYPGEEFFFARLAKLIEASQTDVRSDPATTPVPARSTP
ncbi:MAG: hypothetical protein ACXW3Q_08370 [Rhodoplanes sp.]